MLNQIILSFIVFAMCVMSFFYGKSFGKTRAIKNLMSNAYITLLKGSCMLCTQKISDELRKKLL